MARPMIEIEELTKSVGDRILFSDVTFGINEGDKIGLIAKNGTGKTSLLHIISGQDSPDSGKVTVRDGIKVGFLDQQPAFNDNETVLQACMSGDSAVAKLVAEYEYSLATGDEAHATSLIASMDALNAWDYDKRAKQMLTQCRISDINAPMRTLSGGQRKRVALCRVLIDNPDVLILDEPTNHLDIEMIEWLESFLSHQRTTILMVTHDRYFLDRICSKIIEIDREQIYTYEGNYDYYLRRRKERIEAMTAELAKVKNTLRREQEWMRRQPQARAGKAKYRIDSFYDLKERSRVKLNEEQVDLRVKSTRVGNKIFEAKRVSKRFGDKIILDDFSYIFTKGEKLGIVGHNGVGKSTFIKMLQGLIKPDEGSIEVGETVRYGYYTQEGLSLDPKKKVIDAVTEIAEDIVINDGERYTPLQFLNHFMFSPSDQQKVISTLSGGEKARLHLAEVLLRSPNFLILDEPTNDLDIVTLGILENYLKSYKGCLIIISHDRFFLDSTIDHLFAFEGNGIIKDFPGNYSEYKQWQRERDAALASLAKQEKKESETIDRRTERTRRLTFKEQRELEALSTEIDALNVEKSMLEKVFSGETAGDVNEAAKRYDTVKSMLDEKELRWLELSEISS